MWKPMTYNNDLWNQYTSENENQIDGEQSKFIFYLSAALGARSVCEAGCNIGNNLSAFPSNFRVHGIDANEGAIEKAKERYQNFTFNVENLKNISQSDSSFDVVFTRGVLIHIPDEEMEQVMNELLRITKKWVFNLEYFGEDGKMIKWKRGNDLLWFRDMEKRWSKFNTKIISTADIPINIDPDNTHLTVVQKL